MATTVKTTAFVFEDGNNDGIFPLLGGALGGPDTGDDTVEPGVELGTATFEHFGSDGAHARGFVVFEVVDSFGDLIKGWRGVVSG